MNKEEADLMKQLFNKISHAPNDECHTDLVNRVQDIEETVDIFERKLNAISSNSLDGKTDSPKLSKIWGTIGGINKNIEKLKQIIARNSSPKLVSQVVKKIDTFTNSDAHNKLLDDFNEFKRSFGNYEEEQTERFALIEKWILADTNKAKCIIKKEIEDNRNQSIYFDRVMSIDDEKKPETSLVLSDVLEESYLARQEARVKFEKETDGWENIETSRLEIGVRTISMLIKNKINTLGELVQHDEKFYLDQPNYGRTSLEKLKKAIKPYGITLKKKTVLQEFKL